jgi:hypothetical protein
MPIETKQGEQSPPAAPSVWTHQDLKADWWIELHDKIIETFRELPNRIDDGRFELHIKTMGYLIMQAMPSKIPANYWKTHGMKSPRKWQQQSNFSGAQQEVAALVKSANDLDAKLRKLRAPAAKAVDDKPGFAFLDQVATNLMILIILAESASDKIAAPEELPKGRPEDTQLIKLSMLTGDFYRVLTGQMPTTRTDLILPGYHETGGHFLDLLGKIFVIFGLKSRSAEHYAKLVANAAKTAK